MYAAKFVPLALLVFLFGHVRPENLSERKECLEAGGKVENTLRDLLLISEKYANVDSMEDINAFCDEAKNLVTQCLAFKKLNCLTTLAQQVFNILIPKFKSFLKERCGANGKAHTLTLVKCASSKNRKPIQLCFRDFSSIIKYTAHKEKQPEEQLGLLCCNYHRNIKCLGPGKLKDCGEVKSSSFALTTMQHFLGDVFGLLCGKFSEGYCQETGYNAKLNRLGKQAYKASDPNEFIILPALKIADNLSS